MLYIILSLENIYYESATEHNPAASRSGLYFYHNITNCLILAAVIKKDQYARYYRAHNSRNYCWSEWS